MSSKKNRLDERQEQVLLQIEHNGCWIAFWGLAAALIVQQIIFGDDPLRLVGEWIVFLVLALYLGGACIKNGIWDRHLSPKASTNALVSLVAAAACGLLVWIRCTVQFPDKKVGAMAAGIWSSGFIFVLCFAALTVSAKVYKDRQKKMEEEPEEKE